MTLICDHFYRHNGRTMQWTGYLLLETLPVMRLANGDEVPIWGEVAEASEEEIEEFSKGQTNGN